MSSEKSYGLNVKLTLAIAQIPLQNSFIYCGFSAKCLVSDSKFTVDLNILLQEMDISTLVDCRLLNIRQFTTFLCDALFQFLTPALLLNN